MTLMFEVLSDPELHKHASKGYKKVGQSIDLNGKEDAEVCREAGVFWNEATTDGFPSMRPRINAEIAAVADEFRSGGLTWCEKGVRRLITPYPKNKKVDRILERIADDFYHDSIHDLSEADDEEGESTDTNEDDGTVADDQAAVADDQAAVAEDQAVAAENQAAVAENQAAVAEDQDMEASSLSAAQADKVYQHRATIAALAGHVDALREIGHLRGVQKMEEELSKEKRKERLLIRDSPAVAESFLRLRKAEERDNMQRRQLVAERINRKRDADKAISDQEAAVAELKRTKTKIQEMENLRVAKHAIKTYTLEALGQGATTKADQNKAKRNRMDVLDRLAKLRPGLSAGQRNDWEWFQQAWDLEMLAVYDAEWPIYFAQLMQEVMDKGGNAFSVFVYNETCRLFHHQAALHVPGS
jgi:hypothetical protein